MAEHVMGNQIVLGTSLAPSNFEKQIRAVQSWIENGFYVVSCNTEEEISVLKSAFSELPVEFVAVERTAEHICGKKLPYIQDILDVVGGMAEKVCGFINSDIIFSHMTNEMYDFILEEAMGSLVFGRRYEINQYSDVNELKWDVNFDGIDLFFMDVNLVGDFYNDGFYVQSGWDLCILTKCKLLGIKIKELVNPIAFHLKHKIQWNFEETGALVRQFMQAHFNTSEHSYKRASDLYYDILYNDCQQICFCRMQKYRCLFVVQSKNSTTKACIDSQDYWNKEVKHSDSGKDFFDIVFYIRGELRLSTIFCKAVVYMMEEFDCRDLNIGSFFISEKEGKKYYNPLSRNLEIVKKINTEGGIFIKAVKTDGGGKSGTIYLPISYELIDSGDREIKTICPLSDKVYIMPAGVRGSEWYDTNRIHFEREILGYIDNDKNKIGSRINEKTVYSVDVLDEDKENTLVIVVSKYYGMEIEAQLSNKIDRNRILNAYYIFDINMDKTIDYFSLNKYLENRKAR